MEWSEAGGMTARPQVELPDNRSTLLSGDLDVFASQYPKTADRIRAELNRLATRLAESEARAAGDARLLEAWDDARSSGTNWNLYTGEDFINYVLARYAAIAQEAEREAGSA